MTHSCKYCHESDPVADFITPCSCKDPVHESCLRGWQNTRKDASVRCEICRSQLPLRFWNMCVPKLSVISAVSLALYMILASCLMYYAQGTVANCILYLLYCVGLCFLPRRVQGRIHEFELVVSILLYLAFWVALSRMFTLF